MDITKEILYAGVNDKEIDLFESQYVVPDGVSYNSYVIRDEKIAVMDTVDRRKSAEWLSNLKRILGEDKPCYLVVSHLEPDHAGSIMEFLESYPDTVLIGNAKTFVFLEQFFPALSKDVRKQTVTESETLSLGKHILQFFMAPMVHWPEVMVTYEQTEKVLFSADGFGKFGTPDTGGTPEAWTGEARRYYINIVGKYGASVQALLKKAGGLEINVIAPLHGPVLRENLGYYIEKYDTWSSYRPEEEGILIAYASIHGNTAAAAKKLEEILRKKGVEKVKLTDLSRDDMAGAVSDAFCYDKMVLACATYDGGMFPCMEDFLMHLKSKAYQKRTVALIENGTWAPMAGKCMKKLLEEMKEITVLENMVTIKSAVNEQTVGQLENMAKELI
ncbi:MAG: FprA family A-type flavoprotein [Lachnospiraceae bacterium]|nr:FprA family A-type flavoprotein [Lachnospiraceae bacterium]